MSVSFYIQNQAARAAAASANDQLAAASDAANKLFVKGNPSASTVPSVLSTADPFAVIDGFGQAVLNGSMNAAILAAQAGSDRVDKETANLNTSTIKPNGDMSSQVTFSGSLGVDFGAAGAPAGGGYSFLDGAGLQSAFKVAFGAKMSEGEAVDTLSRVGNTLTGSTSGPNAHDVFALTLHQDSGLFTFQLLAPIDQKTTKGSYSSIFLQGLMQAKDAAGQKKSLPTIELDVYNDYGPVSGKGNWALLHEGSLTYNAPNGVASTSTSATSTGSSAAKTYTAPTDPRTNRQYTTNTSAGLAVINSLNIFT
jgi:Domain of unknown function (DUF5801)